MAWSGMTAFVATLLSIGVLASFALIGGGAYLMISRRAVKQGLLMLLAAAVTLVNVLMWVAPIPGR
jgi:uncharacterized membrane protein